LTFSFAGATIGFPMLAAGTVLGMKLAGMFVRGLGISFSFPMIATLAAGSFPYVTDSIIGRIHTFGAFAVAAAPFALGAFGDAVGIGKSFWAVGHPTAAGLLATPLMAKLQSADLIRVTVSERSVG
jgi:hypothetical protein